MGGGASLPAPSEIPLEDRKRVFPGGGGPTLDGVAAVLKRAAPNSVLFLTGSGISVSAGLPSFRGAADSLFGSEKGKSLAAKHALSCPESLFDISRFKENPRPFYELATQLFCVQDGEKLKKRVVKPTVFHVFMRLLQDKGLLKRVFTMNVDCLERRAGIDLDKLVEAHGSFAETKCMVEGCTFSASEVWLAEQLLSGVEVPKCGLCGAVVKPAITFYGEALPDRYHKLSEEDTKDDGNTSLLIVSGTTLAVAPVNRFPGKVGVLVPRLLVNREMVDAEEPPELEPPAVAGAGKEEAKGEGGEKGGEGEGEGGKDKSYDDKAWKGALHTIFGSGTNTSFRFHLDDNYRDVFFQGDADAGAVCLASKCGWLEDLKTLYARVVGPTTALPPVFRTALSSLPPAAAAGAIAGLAAPKTRATAAPKATSVASSGAGAGSITKPVATKPASNNPIFAARVKPTRGARVASAPGAGSAPPTAPLNNKAAAKATVGSVLGGAKASAAMRASVPSPASSAANRSAGSMLPRALAAPTGKPPPTAATMSAVRSTAAPVAATARPAELLATSSARGAVGPATVKVKAKV